MKCQSESRERVSKFSIYYGSCGRKAKVVAEIPLGENTLTRYFCEPCAERRVADVNYSRGVEVKLTPIN